MAHGNRIGSKIRMSDERERTALEKEIAELKNEIAFGVHHNGILRGNRYRRCRGETPIFAASVEA